jgi:hypothetical protein
MENDVNNQAETTAADSSISEQPAQDQSQATATTPVDDLESKTVPYSRFKEVIDKNHETVTQLQSRLDQLERSTAPKAEQNPQIEQVKQQLKALGFVSKDEVDQMTKQQQENARVAAQLEKLEGTYDGKDGRPKFNRTEVIKYALDKGIMDPELAYKTMHEKDLLDWHIQKAISNAGGTRSEASDGSGSAHAAGTANADLKQAAISGDASARRTLIKRLLEK